MTCGNGLSGLVEGTLVQCFACGTENVRTEALDLLTQFVGEHFSTFNLEEFSVEPSKSSLQERGQVVESLFHDLMGRSPGEWSVVATKLDEKAPAPEAVLERARDFGLLCVFMDNFLLPFEASPVATRRLREMYYRAKAENAALTGHWHSLVSRAAFKEKVAKRALELCARSLRRAVTICGEAEAKWSVDFGDLKICYDVGSRFAALLQRMVSENPAYLSQEMEDLVVDLGSIEIPLARALRSQIQRLYDLANSVQFILEELRHREPFGAVEVYREHCILFVEDTIQRLEEAINWLVDVRERFKASQRELMKLHLGKLVPYLNSYRTEFEGRFEAALEQFDDMLEKVIINAVSDHAIEYFELFDEVESLFTAEGVDRDSLIGRLAAFKDDLVELDDALKKLAFSCFKLAQERNLERALLPQVVQSISDKHAHFDLKLLEFITSTFNEFQESRNAERLTIEEQREYFVGTLQPQVRRLVDASFAIKERNVPYPLFLEFLILTTELEVNRPQRLALILENPSTVDVKDVSVSFFVPASFDVKQRHVSLSRLRAGEKKAVGTEITPTEPGPYTLMAMVQYEHVNETFWLPSVRLEISVKGDRELEEKFQRVLAGGGDAGTSNSASGGTGEGKESSDEAERDDGLDPSDLDVDQDEEGTNGTPQTHSPTKVPVVDLSGLTKGPESWGDEEKPEGEEPNGEGGG